MLYVKNLLSIQVYAELSQHRFYAILGFRAGDGLTLIPEKHKRSFAQGLPDCFYPGLLKLFVK
jgi:hypothetical protein